MPSHADLVVVGAGIVGLATARAVLQNRPDTRVVLLEKEGDIAQHQSGRNSGVIHAGVYYAPGSDKATLCRSGHRSMVRFCEDKGIPYAVCGKLIVAVDSDEELRLRSLEDRCKKNGIRTSWLNGREIEEIEPHVRGKAALHVLDTGVVDYRAVSASIAQEIREKGAVIEASTAVHSGRELGNEFVLETSNGSISSKYVVSCAGLQADKVARAISGPAVTAGMHIVPFRGEYFELQPWRADIVRALVYPVPDPQFPFLGVHVTRGIDGNVHVGPNAVLAFKREGYHWRDLDLGELSDTLRFRGFRRLARAHWKYGLLEMSRSLSRRLFARSIQRMVPDIESRDLKKASAGVRAQAVNRDGTLVDDFIFCRSGRALHVLNAPSPAATASLEIGQRIVQQFQWEM